LVPIVHEFGQIIKGFRDVFYLYNTMVMANIDVFDVL
jgi:hypothetical protein